MRRGNRHLMIALTVALGAGVATSMLSVMFNVGDKVNQELKSYGANIVVRPQGAAVLGRPCTTRARPQRRARTCARMSWATSKRSFGPTTFSTLRRC